MKPTHDLKTNRTRHTVSLLILSVVLLLAGCGGGDDDSPLPTVFSLPLDATSAPTATAESVAAASTSDRETLPPTWTITATPTTTETLTVTPSLTITDTPTPSPTVTPSETVEPDSMNLLAQLAMNATVLPLELRPTLVPTVPTGVVVIPANPIAATPTLSGASACRYLPPGGFGQLMLSDPILAGQIGCPLGDPPIVASLSSAYQLFERGAMIWINDIVPHIYVLNNEGTFLRLDDTYVAGVDPESGGQTPPTGLIEPVRGFGKIWRENPQVQQALGWATAQETGGTTTSQEFTQGRMMFVPGRSDILVLFYSGGNASGTWRGVPGQF